MINNRPPLLKRQLLVDKKMQLPLLIYSVCMVSVGIVASAAFSVLWAASLQLGYPTWVSQLVLVSGAVFSFLVMLFVGLFITNKIAGPLFRLRLHMKSIADGSAAAPLVSREDDYTSELFTEYNRLIEKFSQKSN